MQIIPDVIKEKLQNDEATFNIRMHFPNGERTDICNDMIVEGSAKFTESLCSQNEIKLGLCESPVFECETVNVGNIKGATFVLTYEILCGSDVPGAVWKTDIQKYVFEIQKGIFVVQSCDRQADMQHRKVVAYSGGAITDWSMPEWVKLLPIDRNGYNVNLSQIIESKFNGGTLEKMKLNTSIFEKNFVDIYVCDITQIHNSLIQVDFKVLMNAKDAQRKIEELRPNSKIDIEDLTPRYWITDMYYLKEHDRLIVDDSVYVNEIIIPYKILVPGPQGGQFIDLIDFDSIKVNKVQTDLQPYFVNVSKSNYKDFLQTDLLRVAESLCEINGKLGLVNINNELELVDIKKQFYLLPNDDLQPDEQLKPLGVTGGSISKSMYSDLWYDEAYTKPFGAVSCQYKSSDNKDYVMYVYCEGYNENSDVGSFQTYDISNNEIIKSKKYTNAEIRTILTTIANALSGVSYVPLQMKSVALPYVEVGDTLEVLTQNNDSITTIVLRRSLSGESYVTDEFTSK